MGKSIKDNIVRLFDSDDENLPELPLDLPHSRAADVARKLSPPGIDLSGRPRVIMVFGPGRSGKSMLVRYALERVRQRDDGQPVAMVTMDVARPTLRRYFPEAMAPASLDAAPGYLQWVLNRLARSPMTTMIDFGADQSLAPLLSQVPLLCETLERAGLAVVALYMLTPRQEDLTLLSEMESAGFRPVATALVCNLGVAPSQVPEVALGEFKAIRRHSVYRAAMGRGALELIMPRHYAAQEIENRAPLLFHQAADEEATELGVATLSFVDVQRSKGWLAAMQVEMSPITTWLP